MSRLRVVFMGTPDFAVPTLRALSQFSDVVAVYTQPDRPAGRGLGMVASPVKKAAIELGIEVRQPERLSQPGVLEVLESDRTDVIVVVAYGQILKKNILDLPRLGCVNVHSSLLPRWRGAAPIHWAILAGDSKTGVTTMKMVEKLDAGDIYLQSETDIRSDDTASSLHDRLAQMGGQLIQPTLEGLALGQLRGVEQDESQVTYASKLSKEMETLIPTLSVSQADARVRALNPWPGTSVVFENGQRLKVRRAIPLSGSRAPAGVLVEHEGELLLGFLNGALRLDEVQAEGKKAVSGRIFLNGLRGKGEKVLPWKVRAG